MATLNYLLTEIYNIEFRCINSNKYLTAIKREDERIEGVNLRSTVLFVNTIIVLRGKVLTAMHYSVQSVLLNSQLPVTQNQTLSIFKVEINTWRAVI